jgi:hypothetical protein
LSLLVVAQVALQLQLVFMQLVAALVAFFTLQL